nr:hypothetical protein BaRGS_021074 [Batillaria attramentaria]
MDPKRQLFEKERGPDNKTSDLKDQAKDFISSTTAHGLKNVFEKERGIARRCLWLLLVLTAIASLVYMICTSVNDITSYPFRTVTSLNMTSPLPFPAVTVCNLNPLDLTKLPSESAAALQSIADPSSPFTCMTPARPQT